MTLQKGRENPSNFSRLQVRPEKKKKRKELLVYITAVKRK